MLDAIIEIANGNRTLNPVYVSWIPESFSRERKVDISALELKL